MRRKAFTLIELLVVISIIGLLSTIAVVSLGASRAKAKAARTAADLKQISTALQLYVADNGVYPCFDHTFDDSKETAWSAPYLKWPKSQYGGHYHWEHWAAWNFLYSISMDNVPLADAKALANLINNGNLNSGVLQIYNGTDPVRLEWGGVDQAMPVPVPETCP